MNKMYELDDKSRVTMDHKDSWYAKYRGIGFEVCKWQDSQGKDIWNYYLYIYEKMISDSLDTSDMVNNNIYHPLAKAIEFHFGCTYANVIESNVGKLFKLGCDYNHLWDEGCTYSVDIVMNDAIYAIDSLYENIKGIKVFNQKDGSWILAENAVCTSSGSCYERQPTEVEDGKR